MLTRAQIQRIAQRSGIGAQAQERDYIQHITLFSLYSITQPYVFKGGTAIRIVYRGNRYSEDLDFNYSGDIDNARSIWNDVLHHMEYFGCSAEIRNSWKGEHSYSFDISYQGPLYDGRDRTKGKVRVDISFRDEKVETQRVLITSEYDDLRPFVISVLNPAHLMAEKIRALLIRNKPRDAYDIWLLSRQGIKPNIDLINQKLAIYDLEFSKERFDQAILEARLTWEQDLGALLPQHIGWDEVEAEFTNLGLE